MLIHDNAGPVKTYAFRWVFCTALAVCSIIYLASAIATEAADSTKSKSGTRTVHPQFDRDIRPILA